MTRWLRVGGGIALMFLVIEAAVALPLSRWVGQLVHWMQAAGSIGALVYSVTYVVATVFMLPGAILTAGAGLAYGPLWGTLLVSPVSVLGATCAFLLGRSILRDWVARRTARDPKFRAVDAAIAGHGLTIVILLRLSPVFPFNVLNYALALTGVTLRDYVLGSFVGMLPGTLLYVYVGSVVGDIAAVSQGTTQTSTAHHLLSGVGLAATIAVTAYVTRLARGALADQLGQQSDAIPRHVEGR